MMAHLLAEIRTNREKMDANQAKSKAYHAKMDTSLREMREEMRASQQHLKEEVRASQELLKEEMLAKVDAHHERMMARMDCPLENVEAYLEKMEATEEIASGSP
jgi:hypothetical protein